MQTAEPPHTYLEPKQQQQHQQEQKQHPSNFVRGFAMRCFVKLFSLLLYFKSLEFESTKWSGVGEFT